MPTETVYGLAARIDSRLGIERIFQQKERPSFDPLIVHVATLEQAKTLVTDWPPLATELAGAYWPGPMTLVLPKSDLVDSRITSGLDTVAIRMPDHPIALELIQRSGPLAAPSANRFGKTSPTTARHVVDEFPDLIKAGTLVVLDGGPCAIGLESSVLRLSPSGSIEILRPGAITESDLKKRFPQLRIETASKPDSRSPGHLEHHYMPQKPLIRASEEVLDKVRASGPQVLGPLLDEVLKATGLKRVEDLKFTEVRHHKDARIAARELYQKLRGADQETESQVILIEDPGEASESIGTLWSAIHDRIKRAARWSAPSV